MPETRSFAENLATFAESVAELTQMVSQMLKNQEEMNAKQAHTVEILEQIQSSVDELLPASAHAGKQPVNETMTTPDSPSLATPTGQALSESSGSIIPHSGQPLQLQDVVSSEPNAVANNRVPQVEVPSFFATDSSSILMLNDAEISEESFETKLDVSNTVSDLCLLPVCGNASMYLLSLSLAHETFNDDWCPIQLFYMAEVCSNPPWEPPDDRIRRELKLMSLPRPENDGIENISRVGKWNEAMSLLAKMQMSGVSPDVITYYSLIYGFSVNGKWEEARAAFVDMEKNGVSFIHGLCNAGKLDKAKGIFCKMKGSGIIPNVMTYCSMISGLCDAGSWKEAETKKGVAITLESMLKIDTLDDYVAELEGEYKTWMIEAIDEDDDFVRISYLQGVEFGELMDKVTISISFVPALGGYAFKDGYLPSPLDLSLMKEMSFILHSEMFGELNEGYDILHGAEELLVIWQHKPPPLPPENVLKTEGYELLVNQIIVPDKTSWKNFFAYFGPGFLVSIAYIDPGNFETDLQAGAQYKCGSLGIILVASCATLIIQSLAANLGVVTGKHLAEHCRKEYSKVPNFILWVLAEIAIVACDIPEVIGIAFALNMLVKIPIWCGVLLTGLSTLVLLALQQYGVRKLEFLIAFLVFTIAAAFLAELGYASPEPSEVLNGLFVPQLKGNGATGLAISLLGVMVMPHNLFLHSALVLSREIPRSARGIREACRFCMIESGFALMVAFLIDVAIISVSGAVCSSVNLSDEDKMNCSDLDLNNASFLLRNVLGKWSSRLFAIALLASGQSSTITGTYAGQYVMQGFLDLRLEPWIRNFLTRCLAIVPSLIVALIGASSGAGELIIIASMILSFELPFALIPLLKFTNCKTKMDSHANSAAISVVTWIIGSLIMSINMYYLPKYARNNATVFRTQETLEEGCQLTDEAWENFHETIELENLLINACITMHSVEARKERGAHAREDFTTRDDAVAVSAIPLHISKLLIFSSPRPPESGDLEDKVNFKEGGMLHAQISQSLGGLMQYVEVLTFGYK